MSTSSILPCSLREKMMINEFQRADFRCFGPCARAPRFVRLIQRPLPSAIALFYQRFACGRARSASCASRKIPICSTSSIWDLALFTAICSVVRAMSTRLTQITVVEMALKRSCRLRHGKRTSIGDARTGAKYGLYISTPVVKRNTTGEAFRLIGGLSKFTIISSNTIILNWPKGQH